LMAPVDTARADISAKIVVPSPSRWGTSHLLLTRPPYGGVVNDDRIGPDSRVTPSRALTLAVDAVGATAVDAQRFETAGVTRATVDQLAEAGVLSAGLVDGWTPAQIRELHEQLAGASGALWFVLTQHRSPAEAARTSTNDAVRERWATGLATGALLGAVSFAHLRRPGPPTVTAVREDGGWCVSGRLDWITSWGLADALLLMAETEHGDVVQALLPASARPGLTIGAELPLAAMQGTSTVGAQLRDMHVADSEVVRVLPKSEWMASDALRTANTPPAVLGLTRAALNELFVAAESRGSRAATDLAKRWHDELVGLRSRAYSLVDDVDPGEAVAERVRLRAAATKLALDVTAVLITVRAGRAMLLTSPEQRWAREALFALVQAQTQVTREALLTVFAAE
jgi:alkylation response protein AidB-like acyl-CoA dehydrogenase